MLADQPLYEEKFAIRFGEPQDSFYYFFDYDERHYGVNMKFQHFHPYYEMFVLLSEEAEHIIEGQRYPLSMYDIVCLRPGLLHKSHYPGGAAQKRLIINFSFPELFGKYLPEYKSLLSLFDEQLPIFRFDDPLRQELFLALNKIFTGNKALTSLERLRTHHAFVDFLATLHLNRTQNLYRVEANKHGLTEKIYDICACINAHYPEPLTLESLSQRFFISPFYLSHQFKQVTHFCLTEYIQRTRVRNAQQALVFSDNPITAISESCGFKSLSQFNRVFRKYSELTPSQYRKDNRSLRARPM